MWRPASCLVQHRVGQLLLARRKEDPFLEANVGRQTLSEGCEGRDGALSDRLHEALQNFVVLDRPPHELVFTDFGERRQQYLFLHDEVGLHIIAEAPERVSRQLGIQSSGAGPPSDATGENQCLVVVGGQAMQAGIAFHGSPGSGSVIDSAWSSRRESHAAP